MSYSFIVCEDCSGECHQRCYVCDKGICNDCCKYCNECFHVLCNDCIYNTNTCNYCDKLFCDDCTIQCPENNCCNNRIEKICCAGCFKVEFKCHKKFLQQVMRKNG